MIYRIDLIKGQGLPQRPQPMHVILSVVTAAIPAIAIIILAVLALDSRIAATVRQRELFKVRVSLEKTSEAMKQREALQKGKADCVARSREIKDLLARHTQWSQILAALADNMPRSLTLTSVKVRQDQVRQQRPPGADKAAKAEIQVAVRKMEIGLQVDGRVTDSEDVRQLREKLYECPALKGRLEPIGVTQAPGSAGGKDVTCYQLTCVFKAGR
jgi:hypothetical protein